MVFSDPGSPYTKNMAKQSEKDLLKENGMSNKLKFKCSIENCGAAYKKNWLLEEHIRKHNKERPFVCSIPECLKSFTKESHLTRHKVMVHEKACEQMCDITGCGKVFNNKYSLKKHKNKVHIENKYHLCCNECSKRFNKKWKLNQHMYIHTGETPFKCIKCNLGFTVERDLKKHNRNHKSYPCDCGEVFERWSLLRCHKKDNCVHIDKKCKNCGKSFTQKHNLSSHYKTCNKDHENFQCPYMDCTRIYLHKRNLNWHIANTHEKSKTEAKNFKCINEGCDKAFSKKCFLNRHLKSHDVNFKSKPKKPRATRKDKGESRTYIAATLSGIKLSQKEHMEILKGNINLLSKISETQPESPVEVLQENETHIQKKMKLEADAATNEKLFNSEIAESEAEENLDDRVFWKIQTIVENDGSTSHNVKTKKDTDPAQNGVNDDVLFKECNPAISKIEKCLA